MAVVCGGGCRSDLGLAFIQVRETTTVDRGQARRARSKSAIQGGTSAYARSRIARGNRWFWFICPRCKRRTPKTLAPFAIRYGMDVPTIDIAKFAACQRCGHFGALLQRPSMDGIGVDMALEPFPAELAMQGGLPGRGQRQIRDV